MALVKLSPVFNAQIIDENGSPANGWKINTYIAGTSTPAVTYTDSSGLVAQSNPIIINSLGFTQNGQIWLVTGIAYKLVLTDALGVIKKTEDNISGVNDTTNASDEWLSIAGATYISASSYSLVGDQTSEYHIGRRNKFTTNVGTVYGRITASSFLSGITTITVQMDGSQILDIGLSSVQNSILRNNVLALPERIATTSGTNTYTATVGTTRLVLGDEYKLNFSIANDGTIAPTLNLDGLGARSLFLQNGAIPSAGQINGEHKIRDTASGFIVLNPVALVQILGVRQCVTSAPVDANGATALGGTTGSTTVTTTAISASSPITVNIAMGLHDLTGISVANLSWTGLSVNGTMQLSLDGSANGTLTPVSGTLLTNYQQGGTFSIVNGQHTFNIGVMNQTVGNGTTAVQSSRVAVGEVTVAGGVVTAITWYALNGYYDSGLFAVAASTTYTKQHLLGFNSNALEVHIADDAAGTNERQISSGIYNGASDYGYIPTVATRNATSVVTLTGPGYGTGGLTNPLSSAFYRYIIRRNWR